MFTADQFVAEHPHFLRVDRDLIGVHVANAEAELHEGTFGASYRRAVFLKAAHTLSVSPRGQKARLDAEDTETTYSRELDRLIHIKGTGGRVTP